MKVFLLSYLLMLLLDGCQSKKQKTTILLANREAPLGWVYLKLYSDSSFEFISAGLRDSNYYPGQFKLHGDTLQFEYFDSIPPLKAHKAIFVSGSIVYIDGTYPEALEIKMNNIKKKEY